MNKKHIRKTIILSTIGILLLGTSMWWLFNTGRLAYIANPGSTSMSSSLPCGTEIVDRYNAAMYYQIRAGSPTSTMDEVGIKNLVSEIKTKPNYKVDPTCQTILFWTAVHNDDYAGARTAFEAVKDFHNKGVFADTNIRSNSPIFSYEGIMSSLSGAGGETTK